MQTPSPLRHQHIKPTPKFVCDEVHVFKDKQSDRSNSEVYRCEKLSNAAVIHGNKFKPRHSQQTHQLSTGNNITHSNGYEVYSSKLNQNAPPFKEKEDGIVHSLSI